MSKSPQGVYVNEVEHNRITRLVDNALDGHGNLSGFIDFIQQSLLQAANTPLDGIDYLHGDKLTRKLSFQAQAAFRDESNNTRYDPPSRRLEKYEGIWKEILDHLPWTPRDGRDNAFALYLHRHQWKQDDLPANNRQRRPFRSVGEALRGLQAANTGHYAHLQAALDAETVDVGLPLWQGNNLDVLLTEAKSKSTSFYLNPEAHELTLRIFGREFFSWIERSLLRLLDNPQHWLHLEPELRFLEHGSALIDYQHAYWDQRDANDLKQELKEFVADDPDWDDNEKPTLDIWIPEAQFYPSQYLPTEGGFSWYSAREEDFVQPQNRLGAFQDSLVLAYRLGLTDLLQEVDTKAIKDQLLPAFLSIYDLDRIAPERRIAYHILQHRGIPTLPTYVNTANDYHVMKLFQQYAHTVLPDDEKTDNRVHPAVLATLSQPWIFPTRTTLETYANATIEKTATGMWQISKGNTIQLNLTDSEAYWTAKTLNSIFSTQPIRTMYYTDTNPEGDFHLYESEEDEANRTLNHLAWRQTLNSMPQKSKRIRYKLGPELIRKAKDLITTNGPAIGPRTPISAGALLIAELTDQTLQANGRFITEFKKRTIHDFSDFMLEPEQHSTLTRLLEQFRKHHVPGFHKTSIQFKSWHREELKYVWAYHHDDTEYTLGATYKESIKKIALTHANYPEDNFRGPFTWAIRQPHRWNEKELHDHLTAAAQTPQEERDHNMPIINNAQFDPKPIIQAVIRYYQVCDSAGIDPANLYYP